jgi:hypothetical protein
MMLWRAKVGNSLLERMSRPVVPAFPGGYVIQPGMRAETARSMFHAVGARHSSEIHNSHYPNLTYQGYLLPDNTMVYLRLDKNAGGKIVSIGVGAHAAGCDSQWPWDDESKNSTRKLELKPNTSTFK